MILTIIPGNTSIVMWFSKNMANSMRYPMLVSDSEVKPQDAVRREQKARSTVLVTGTDATSA